LQLLVDPGAHACQLFENSGEQLETLRHFVKAGLTIGECCVLIVPDESQDDWYFQLQAYGVDVSEERRRGALEVLRATDWYSVEGGFTSVAMAQRLWRMISVAGTRFAGLRLVSDMTSTIAAPLSDDQLCHWEATTNLVLEGSDARTICQYDLNRHPSAVIHNALRTHPQVVVGGRLLANPYYEAPKILANEPFLNHSEADAEAVETMLTSLRNAAN